MATIRMITSIESRLRTARTDLDSLASKTGRDAATAILGLWEDLAETQRMSSKIRDQWRRRGIEAELEKLATELVAELERRIDGSR